MNRKSEPEAVRGKASSASGGRGAAFMIGAIALAAVLCTAGAVFLAARAPPPEDALALGRIGGPFQLTDQDGRRADQHILDGKWSAVFFGYTYCPDTCPATLQALGAASRRLGDRQSTFQTVFISVDPARDTPLQMKTYLQSQGFPAHAIGLTGTAAQVAAAAKAYGVFFAKSGSGADYTVDHSAAVYLMDPKGRFNRPLSHDMAPALIAEQINAAEQHP